MAVPIHWLLSRSTSMATTTQQTNYFGVEIPLMHMMGLVPISMDGDGALTRLLFREDLANSRGDFHGGTLMSVLDFTLSAAARGRYPIPVGMATIDMTTSFLEPARGELLIDCRCIRAGKSIAFCEGEIRNEKGDVVARASGTFKVVPRKPGGD
jgi:uncharacterized protein (TIGR00369 family)